MQAVELGLAIGLAWMGFHAPTVAAPLFGASVAVGCWALIADGSFSVRGAVGLGAHRRGVLILAAGLAVLPLATGGVRHLELVVPCLLCAVVLARVGLVRWPGIERASDAGGSPPADRPPPPVDPPLRSEHPAPPAGHDGPVGSGAPGRRAAVRVLGRAAGRAGTIIGRDASVALPRAARAAGRVAGRGRRPPERP